MSIGIDHYRIALKRHGGSPMITVLRYAGTPTMHAQGIINTINLDPGDTSRVRINIMSVAHEVVRLYLSWADDDDVVHSGC